MRKTIVPVDLEQLYSVRFTGSRQQEDSLTNIHMTNNSNEEAFDSLASSMPCGGWPGVGVSPSGSLDHRVWEFEKAMQ